MFSTPHQVVHGMFFHFCFRFTRKFGIVSRCRHKIHNNGISIPGCQVSMTISPNCPYLCQKIILLRFRHSRSRNQVNIFDYEITTAYRFILPPIIRGRSRRNTPPPHVSHVRSIRIIETDIRIAIFIKNKFRSDIVINPPVVGSGYSGIDILGSIPKCVCRQLIFRIQIKKIITRSKYTCPYQADCKT